MRRVSWNRSRTTTLVAMVSGLSMLGASGAHSSPRLVFNASESVPRGWYVIAEVERPHVGDYVVVQLPKAVRAFAAERGYLPASVPVIKPVIATGGQRVCVDHGSVYIDGAVVADTLGRDGRDRPLPAWRMCRALDKDEIFLLATDSPASFDSRYFGPIDRSFVLGRATPWRVDSSDYGSIEGSSARW